MTAVNNEVGKPNLDTITSNNHHFRNILYGTISTHCIVITILRYTNRLLYNYKFIMANIQLLNNMGNQRFYAKLKLKMK